MDRKATTRRGKKEIPDIRINQDEIDYRNRLVHLMVGQRKVPAGFETLYRASEAHYVRAGVPRVVLQQPTARTGFAFRLNERDALLVRRGNVFEITVQWDDRGPWYHSEAHPALSETARMIRIHAGYWLRDLTVWPSGPKHGLVQTHKLLEEGCDYHQPEDRKYRFDTRDLETFEKYLNALSHAVVTADIHLVEPAALPKPRKPRPPSPAKRAKLAQSAKADVVFQTFVASVLEKPTKHRRKRPGAAP
jgi:hypothetical protein